MSSSLKKYFTQTSDSMGAPLAWPGTIDGFPVRGPVAETTQKEYEEIPIVYDAKHAILELPKDSVRYDEIIDRCANGWYQLRHEERHFDPVTKTYTIFLQWLEIYGEKATTKAPGPVS